MKRTYERLIRTSPLQTAVCAVAIVANLSHSVPVAEAEQPTKNSSTITLFNGKDLSGWTNRNGDAPGAGWRVENGELRLAQKKAGDIWTKARYGDFVLSLEFKTTGNSGVFIRTDQPKNNVQTGIEIQVNRPGGPNRHSVGALYDLVAPSKNAGTNEWNRLVVTCKGSHISVKLNGDEVSAMDLDKWTTARKNPDGSKNKFRTALKNFKRAGHIGLQDHGATVRYRNIKLKTLTAAK